MPYIGLIHGPLAHACMVIAAALIIIVIRAPKNDLVDIVRALMRLEPRGGRRDDDSAKPPPLPKP